jgi:long-chain fatty acid transport protein
MQTDMKTETTNNTESIPKHGKPARSERRAPARQQFAIGQRAEQELGAPVREERARPSIGFTGSRLAIIIGAVAVLLGAPASIRAAGIQLYEIATPDVGLASAGYSARAQDASTLFKNPAGMSRLDSAQFQGGLQLTYGSVEFSPNGNTSARLGNEDSGNAVGALPAASGFYVHPIGEKVRVGLGSFSNFGLAASYDNGWVGRYYVQESALIGVSIMPAAGVQITDWLSIGAGLNAMYGYFNTKVAVNNIEPSQGDGQMKLQDTTWGFGGNAGILIEPEKGTRFGVTYLSPVNLDFKDRPSFSNLGPGLGAILANPSTLDLGVQVPQGVMFGAYHEFSDKFAMMVDFGWQNWEAFGEVQVSVQSATSPDVTANLKYQNTWHGAVGAIYKLTEKWQLTTGFAYDSSAVSDENRTVTVPMGEAWRIGVGASWQMTEKINVNAGYEFLWAGSMSVDQGTDLSLRGRVAGAYADAWFSFFTLNLTWKF